MKLRITKLLTVVCIVAAAPCHGMSRVQRIMHSVTQATRAISAPHALPGDMPLVPQARSEQRLNVESVISKAPSTSSDTKISAEVMALLDDLTADVHPLLKAYYDGPEAFAKAVAASKDIVKDIESARGPEGEGIVDLAVTDGRCDVIELLIKQGIATHSSLYWSSQWRHGTRAMQKLIAGYGSSNINIKDKYGYTALHEAASRGNKEAVECLIRAGADVNAQNKYGRTALHEAAESDRKEIVECLIKAGANLNVKDEYGTTALMYAAEYGHKEIVAYLIKAGADVNAKDKAGWTALMYAERSAHKELVRILEEAQKLQTQKTLASVSSSVGSALPRSRL